VLQEKLTKFILATQDEETGGISDRPGDMVCNNVILTAIICSILSLASPELLWFMLKSFFL